MTIANKKKLFIPTRKDGSKTWKVSRDEIDSLLIDKFTRFFKAKEIRRCESLCEFIPCCVFIEKNASFEAILGECEIWNVVKSMHPIKALGSDEMSVLFFPKYWNIVGIIYLI